MFKKMRIFIIVYVIVLLFQTSFAGNIDYPIPCSNELQTSLLE